MFDNIAKQIRAMADLAIIKNKISKEGLDAFLFNSESNVFYLSKFSSTYAFIVITPSNQYFLTDARYYENAKAKLQEFEVVQLQQGTKGLKLFLNDLGIKTLGFEKDRVTLDFYENLKEGLQAELLGYTKFLEEFRTVKTEEEIQIIRTAVHKIDDIYSGLIEWLRSNDISRLTESMVRRKLVDLILQEGGSGESFPSIVATGSNSAIPHWETADQHVLSDAPLLIDTGLKYKGYCSDFTRTIYFGSPTKQFEEIYKIVKEANIAATSCVKAGVSVSEIDLAARHVIESYGYGQHFIHSTGHGIGIDIHEHPRVHKDENAVLPENTVITIEPGIYIPGYGGVRLENVVVVRKDSAEVLTRTSLDILTIN
ncbi:MAG: Xaa-Pro dipeptidase [Candidatus Dojkabacteria bacterium]|nr:MAG: Xaa-Pro dipeptidase [Candidatus Dojkabacteria bacterium]